MTSQKRSRNCWDDRKDWSKNHRNYRSGAILVARVERGKFGDFGAFLRAITSQFRGLPRCTHYLGSLPFPFPIELLPQYKNDFSTRGGPISWKTLVCSSGPGFDCSSGGFYPTDYRLEGIHARNLLGQDAWVCWAQFLWSRAEAAGLVLDRKYQDELPERIHRTILGPSLCSSRSSRRKRLALHLQRL